MLHIITCNYYDCETQHFDVHKLKGNNPVNLAMIASFARKGDNQIEFTFIGHPPIIWSFINNALMEKEYSRIYSHVAEIGIGKKMSNITAFVVEETDPKKALEVTLEKVSELMHKN